MSDRLEYDVIKVLNNNVILVRDLSAGQETVLIGNGIGFQCKTGTRVKLPADRIEKSFVAYDKKIKNKYLQIIKQLDGEILGLGEEIILMAEKELGKMNSHIHIALTDHIAFALDRLQDGLEITNPFFEEIKILYNEEYKLGTKAAELIQKRLGVEIPDSEIGFIALHLHAARQNIKVSQTVKYTSLLKQLITIVEDELGKKLNPTELSYTRLLNHLRFSIDRVEKNKKITNPLLSRIKEEFKESYQLADKIANQIEKSLQVTVSEDERGYITLHLYRLKESPT